MVSIPFTFFFYRVFRAVVNRLRSLTVQNTRTSHPLHEHRPELRFMFQLLFSFLPFPCIFFFFGLLWYW